MKLYGTKDGNILNLYTACNCDSSGSMELVCNEETGQCPCESNVAVGGENSTQGTPADLTCSYCKKVEQSFSCPTHNDFTSGHFQLLKVAILLKMYIFLLHHFLSTGFLWIANG